MEMLSENLRRARAASGLSLLLAALLGIAAVAGLALTRRRG